MLWFVMELPQTVVASREPEMVANSHVSHGRILWYVGPMMRCWHGSCFYFAKWPKCSPTPGYRLSAESGLIVAGMFDKRSIVLYM